MFVVLLVNDNIVQFAHAKTLRNSPGNTRVLFQQYERKRGDIATSTGVPIATSVATLALKFGAYHLTGSLSLWSDAMEALVIWSDGRRVAPARSQAR